MDPGTRAFMEPRFGHDFSTVRLHADGKAAESAKAVNALAYTVGNHVVFGAGQYKPGSHEGRKLLAHELAHTVQQAGRNPSFAGKLEIGDPGDVQEQEADAVSARVTGDGGFNAVSGTGSTAPPQRRRLQRQPDPSGGVPPSNQPVPAGGPDAGTPVSFKDCTPEQNALVEAARKAAVDKSSKATIASQAVSLGNATDDQKRAMLLHFKTANKDNAFKINQTFNTIFTYLLDPGHFVCVPATSPFCTSCGGENQGACACTPCSSTSGPSRLCPGVFNKGSWNEGTPQSPHFVSCAEPDLASALLHEAGRAAGCCKPDVQPDEKNYPPSPPDSLTNVFSYTGFARAIAP
jgi:hypothetical protein